MKIRAKYGVPVVVAVMAIIAGNIWGGGGFEKEEGETFKCYQTLHPTETAAQLETKANLINGGETFCLAGGSYVGFGIKGAHPTSTAIFRPVSGETATINGVREAGVHNVTFEKLNFSEGINIEDTSTFKGSENDHVIEDNFENAMYGVNVTGYTGIPITGTVIEYSTFKNIHLKTEEVGGNEVCSPHGANDGTGLEIGNASGVTFKHNTLNGVEWHYIQGGGTGLGVTVEYNLFEEVDKENCAHLNAWQIFGGGENDTFKNNIVKGKSVSEPASVIALIFENGAAGAECSVTMKNVKIENNVFVFPSTSNVMQIGQIENLTIKNNTGVKFQTGLKALTGCGPSTNAIETNNIMVEGQNAGAEKAGFIGFECTGICEFDYNVSSDTSANAHGSTHFKTSWSPEWESTEYGNPGYYKAKGLSFETGYQGGGGP